MTKKNPDFNFPVSSLADWQEMARQELGEKEPMEKLSRKKGSIKIKPYYNASTASQIEEFQQLPAVNPYYGARSWMNTPRIQVANEKQPMNSPFRIYNPVPMEFYLNPLKRIFDLMSC